VKRRTAACLSFASVLIYVGLASSAEGKTQPGQLIPLVSANGVAFGARAVWVTTPRWLIRIDPARNVVVARIRLPEIAGAAAVDGRYVWVLTNPIHTSPNTSAPGLLWSVDMTTNRVVGKPISLSPMAQGRIAVAGGSLWVTNDNHGRYGRLYQIDPKTRQIVGTVRIPNDPSSVVFGNGSLWVGESDSGQVVRVNPATGTVEGKPITAGGALLTLAADGDKVWVANSYSGRFVTINATSARVVANRPLAGITGLAVSRGTVWATFSQAGKLAAFDAASGRQTLAPFRIRGGADGVEADSRSVWVISSRGVTRISS
jgi:DNA-binding beta-propeller fold protein YncE